MIPITSIKSGQRWGFKKVRRGDVEISHVNESNKTIFWSYVDYNSNVFDSPYERFLEDFVPRDPVLLASEIGPGPNEDRDFLL